MWAKIYEITGVSEAGLSNATLQVWKDGSNYKLAVLNDGNGNNGDYSKLLIETGGTNLKLIKFAAVDGTNFYYKEGDEDKGLIYVTPSGIAIIEK